MVLDMTVVSARSEGAVQKTDGAFRREAQLEALKQRIAESARKAGLDSEFETVEKSIRVYILNVISVVLYTNGTYFRE